MLTFLVLLLAACSDADKQTPDDTGVDTADGNCENPDAIEICDGVDNDCDGVVDEDPSDPGTWYLDTDGDGFGDPLAAVLGCVAPTGAVTNASDCDDADAAVNPDAAEVCDRVDNDCDGTVDLDVVGSAIWYPDADADGFGDAAGGIGACEAPTGHVAEAGDCDDANLAINPDATEVCDEADNDCDGLIDDADPSLADALTWYADSDGDEHGDTEAAVSACAQPEGYVGASGDCDDGDGAVHPGAAEICDAADTDEDCDGRADDSDDDVDPAGMSTWHPDADGDGYGDASSAHISCDAPARHIADAADCDDGDDGINPSALEVCDDRVDNDCDREVDEECDTGGDDTGGELAFCDGLNTGDTFQDGYSTGGPGLLIGMAYTPTSDTDIGRVDVFTGEGWGTNTVALWTNDGGFPGEELATGSWSMDRANGWQGADLDTCVPVTAGTTYWVVWGPVNGAQSSLDASGTTGSYSGSFDGGGSWSGPYSGYVKYQLSCCG